VELPLLLAVQHAPDQRHGVEILDNGKLESWHSCFDDRQAILSQLAWLSIARESCPGELGSLRGRSGLLGGSNQIFVATGCTQVIQVRGSRRELDSAIPDKFRHV